MLTGTKSLPENLQIRPARPEDNGFLESLYRSTRDDLRLIDAADDVIEELISMQYRAQTQGYGDTFPNAMHFVVAHLGAPIGRIVVNFGHNEVRLVDIAFVPQARGHGYGSHVIRALQLAADRIHTPVTLSVNRANVAARRTYLALGFAVERGDALTQQLIWYPSTTPK